MVTRQIVLRYRASGHVRFQLPMQLCEPEAARLLVAELRRTDGVYRVRLAGHKLSVRYHESFLSFGELARRLHAVVTGLKRSGRLQVIPPAPRGSLFARAKRTRPVRWLREQVQAVRETLTAFGMLAKHGLKRGPKFLHDPKELAFEFANDVLVLYLIKAHWHRIVSHWIPHPIRYRYEWAAVFYLTYLLVRSRLPKR